MKKRFVKKSVGIILSFILIFSTFAISFQAYAADTKENIIIANVSRRYDAAKTIFDQINDLRSDAKISELKMDKNLMEAAMKRAAELSISYDIYALDGSEQYGENADNIVYGYCDLGFGAFMGMALGSAEKAILKSSDYKSVGVGTVIVNGKNLVCILLSCKTADEVDSSIYSQGSVTVQQKTTCLKSKLSNVKLIYSDGQEIACGSNCVVYLVVINNVDKNITAYLSSDCLKISSSNTDVLSVSNGYMKAVKPGTSSVTAYLKDDPSVFATSLLKVVGLSLEDCTINNIGEMKYTGKPIEPDVVITDSDGNRLVKGEDYILSYSNNINVGTASVKITGIGKYEGEECIKYFKIVSNGDIEYRASMEVSASEVGADEVIKLTAKNNLEDTTTMYSFDYSASGSNKWNSIQSASSNNKATLRISVPGKYILRVTATNGSGMTATSQCTVTINPSLSLGVSLDSTKVVLGNYIKITAQGSGSVAPYTYSYMIANNQDGKWINIKTNTSDTSATYKPTATGSYSLKVRCQSKTGYMCDKTFVIDVINSSLTNESSMSASSINSGESVQIFAVAKGGTAPYTYAFTVKHSTASAWTVLKDYNTTATKTWIPVKTGTYQVCAKVKDSKGTEVKKFFTLTVKAVALTNNSTISKTTINQGESVTLKAVAIGGTSPYTYAFTVKHSTASSWTSIKGYNTTATKTWTPAKTGTYQVCAKVKDSKGTEVKKFFTLTVK